MLDRELGILINKELDGTLTEEERNRLGHLLSMNPEARQTRDELGRIITLLNETGEVEPPVTLKAGVMRRIEAQVKPLKASPSIVGRLVDVLAPVRDWRLVYAFAGGIVLGGLLYALGSGASMRSNIASEDAVGTVGAPRTKNELVSDGFTSLAHDGVEAGALHGYVRAAKNASLYRLQCELVAPDSLSARFSFDGDQVMVEAIIPHPASSNTLRYGPGQILIHARKIEGLTLLFRPRGDTAGAVHVTVSRGGEVAYERDFAVE